MLSPTNLGREDVFIVELLLYPCHEVVDVLWSRTFDWLLHSLTVCPVVLVSGWKRGIEGEWREGREKKGERRGGRRDGDGREDRGRERRERYRIMVQPISCIYSTIDTVVAKIVKGTPPHSDKLDHNMSNGKET